MASQKVQKKKIWLTGLTWFFAQAPKDPEHTNLTEFSRD
jgi:hypothetical protein